jgi:hypothetical protein
MFRMGGGANAESAKAHRPELEAIARRAGCFDSAFGATHGCGAPRDVVRVTQALIDAGKLPKGPGSLEQRIRSMQWEWGVGVDCARYSREALTAANGLSDGKLRMYASGTEGFRDMDHPLPATPKNPHPLDKREAWKRVDVKDCRPGDLITLDPKPPETVGHNVAVYSNEVLSADQQAALSKKDPKVAELFTSPGPFRRIKVDSSWGAGSEGADYGGFRRESWLYDESTKQWGFVDRESGKFVISKDGPATYDRFHGAYRPKAGV